MGLVKDLYYRRKFSMREVAERFGVSPDAVVYFMRRHNLPRRSFSEINRDRFEKKKPSFETRKGLNAIERELKVAGTMLYWGEGYKSERASFVDFANSDPSMVKVFVNFLRKIYKLNESKFRVLLYCYADQNVPNLIRFWSELTGIPKKQFTKPYVRKDFRGDKRKMPYGLVHIRYIDKKLLLDIKRLIVDYCDKFTRIQS